MRRRTKSEDVQQQRLVVTLPAIWQEAAFGVPSERNRGTVVLRPEPVRAQVECIGQRADFIFGIRCCVKISARSECACQKKCAVDSRQLTSPRAATGLHVDEMVIETFVTRGVRLRTLRTVPEKSQRCQHAFD